MQSHLTPPAAKLPLNLYRTCLTALDRRVLACSVGHYPWDDWERVALAAGLPEELAGLGRAVMREAYQHGWPPRLQSLCGWRDEGRRMLQFALRAPAKARYRWHRLLETDGYRGEWKNGQWISKS